MTEPTGPDAEREQMHDVTEQDEQTTVREEITKQVHVYPSPGDTDTDDQGDDDDDQADDGGDGEDEPGEDDPER
jgi:hypothetical protein